MSVEGPLIYFDANCFIIATESDGEEARMFRRVLEAAGAGRGRIATSELTIAEILAGVEQRARKGDLHAPTLKRLYLELLVYSGAIELVPITRDALYETAKLRAVHPRKLNLPDAIHLVTAIRCRCRFFMTNDRRIRTPAGGPTLLGAAEGDVGIIVAELSR